MKRVAVAVSDSEHEALRQAADARGRSLAQRIRDALSDCVVSFTRGTYARPKKRWTDVPVLEGHRWIGPPLEPGEAFGEMADERFDRATSRANGNLDPIDEEGWE